ncbi:MAG TPA: hypothetical protein VGI82_07140 [Chitinophagaceae bacterium]
MLKLLLTFFLIIAGFSSFAQVSDIISVKKKNGRTVKSFYEGVRILYQTKYGDYIEGPIEKIYHDTVFIRMYMVQKGLSQFGSYVFDTLNSYLVKTNYKDIKRVSVYRRGSNREKLGDLMMIGGAGYAALNLINGSLFSLPITDKKNLRTLGISLSAVAIGFLNNKLFASNPYSRRKDQVIYISLQR